MKLIRFGEPGKEKPGVLLDDQTRLDVSSFVSDYDEEFFGSGGLARLRQWLKGHAPAARRVGSALRLGPPIHRPSKIVCVGLNYRDHAAESGMQLPSEPVLFFKATSSLAGPNDALVIPRGAEKVDWEVELAVIIEKEASYVPKEQASEFIVGYALHNDYSERSFQLERGGQWMKGKSADTFAPLGPFLITRDEVPKPDRLGMWLTVNGEFRQKSTTAEMVFDVPTLVSCERVHDALTRRHHQYWHTRRGRPGNAASNILATRRCRGTGDRSFGYRPVGSDCLETASLEEHWLC